MGHLKDKENGGPVFFFFTFSMYILSFAFKDIRIYN